MSETGPTPSGRRRHPARTDAPSGSRHPPPDGAHQRPPTRPGHPAPAVGAVARGGLRPGLPRGSAQPSQHHLRAQHRRNVDAGQ